MRPTPRTRPLPDDGLQRVLREGKARRRKAAALIGAPSLSLAVALAIVLQGGVGGSDSLRTLNDPTPTDTSTATPDPASTPGAGAGATAGAEASGSPQSSQPDPGPSEVCIDYCDPSGGPEPEARAVEVRTDSHSVGYTATCTGVDANPNDDYAFCGHVSGPSGPLKPSDPAQLSYEFCRALDSHPGPLTFDWATRQEHDGYIATGASGSGERVWTWSADKVFPGSAHQASMTQQQCFTWTVDFPGEVDGQPLPRGTYYMGLFTTERGGPKASTEVKITVTD